MTSQSRILTFVRYETGVTCGSFLSLIACNWPLKLSAELLKDRPEGGLWLKVDGEVVGL